LIAERNDLAGAGADRFSKIDRGPKSLTVNFDLDGKRRRLFEGPQDLDAIVARSIINAMSSSGSRVCRAKLANCSVN